MAMGRFPVDLRDALRPNAYPRRTAGLLERRELLAWFPDVIRPTAVSAYLTLLERHMTPFLEPFDHPIPKEALTGMRRNFTEKLPKTFKNHSVILNSPRSRATLRGRSIGLVPMLTSSSLRELAEQVSGHRLKRGPGLQVIRYQTGDYVGPHNDHHPEEAHLREGYVDLQITLCNRAVRSQHLVYERDGFLNASVNVGIASGISISRLPFWHQVTPLESKPGRETEARRWLLLASFEIEKKRRIEKRG